MPGRPQRTLSRSDLVTGAALKQEYAGTVGKMTNCQAGVFLAYAVPGEGMRVLIERELYPEVVDAGPGPVRGRRGSRGHHIRDQAGVDPQGDRAARQVPAAVEGTLQERPKIHYPVLATGTTPQVRVI